ncbi:precorrin-3B C(17)-methyltransferase [Streptomyces sp. NBC_01353]|uniref:precorrin-3B C(17)-methyltransferase n=1 Tax=Streptomyces sp. NBC_01353 TaxID=2903835 RepID=UPI002E2F4621|nr:precorrin-3B C(17)-methyltransferase [Streptomyces sp. NBC_01353]
MRSRSRSAAVAALFLVTLAVGGCADPADDPRAAGSRTGSPSCPPPEEQRPADLGPCNSYDPEDPADKYAENHGYRREMELTPEERAGAEGTAETLAAELRTFAGKRVTQDELQVAVARVIGVQENEVEVRGEFDKVLKNVLVGGGHGKVCVNGRIDGSGGAGAEVAGRTMDGTCLPGLGGH